MHKIARYIVLLVIVFALIKVSYALKLYNDDILIDNFSPSVTSDEFKPGSFPDEWKYRNREAKSTYAVFKDNDNFFLRASSNGNGSQVLKKFKADLEKYPVLSWKWRINKFPGEEKNIKERKSDNGASVYAIFGGVFSRKALKYTWSNYNKKNTYIDKRKKMKVFVLRDESDKKNTWVEENINLFADYKKVFGENPPDLAAIAILTDSDQTESYAEADYDDFRLKADHLPEHGSK